MSAAAKSAAAREQVGLADALRDTMAKEGWIAGDVTFAAPELIRQTFRRTGERDQITIDLKRRTLP